MKTKPQANGSKITENVKGLGEVISGKVENSDHKMTEKDGGKRTEAEETAVIVVKSKQLSSKKRKRGQDQRQEVAVKISKPEVAKESHQLFTGEERTRNSGIVKKETSGGLLKKKRLRKSKQKREQGEHEISKTSPPISEFNFNRYHSYDSIVKFMKELAEKHSAFVNFGSLVFKSFEKRDMVYLKFGYRNDQTLEKNIMVVEAGAHAREWVAIAFAVSLMNSLATNAKWTPILRDIDIYVIPMANPDGYEYSLTEDKDWRKTRSGPITVIGKDGIVNKCYGADINRNYPVQFCEIGSSNDPCNYETYCGRAVLSEPETKAVAEFLIRNADYIKTYISLHTYGNFILIPYAYSKTIKPHYYEEMKKVAEKAAKAIKDEGGDQYKVGNSAELMYETSGSSDDFAKQLGIRYAYTLEMTEPVNDQNCAEGDEFCPPPSYIEPTARTVIPAMIVFAEAARDAFSSI